MAQINPIRSAARRAGPWTRLRGILAAALVPAAVLTPQGAAAQTPDIVLVHGMNVDGSSWRAVYEVLAAKGYDTNIVQQPLNGFDRDVEAVMRVLDRHEGDVVLVGHSYGGVVISTAGNHPAVKALVYVAALQPDTGETMASLNETMPSAFDPSGIVASEDGFVSMSPEGFRRDVAPDMTEDDAAFYIASQTPTSPDVFTAETADPAWRHKPTFGIVAGADRVVSPALQRWMYERSGGPIAEIDAGHMLIVTRPEDVAEAIMDAARSLDPR